MSDAPRGRTYVGERCIVPVSLDSDNNPIVCGWRMPCEMHGPEPEGVAEPIAPSRSELRRIAAMKGEPAPTFEEPVAPVAWLCEINHRDHIGDTWRFDHIAATEAELREWEREIDQSREMGWGGESRVIPLYRDRPAPAAPDGAQWVDMRAAKLTMREMAEALHGSLAACHINGFKKTCSACDTAAMTLMRFKGGSTPSEPK